MNSASTTDRSSEIYQALAGDNCKGEVVLYYKNRGDSDWTRLEDLDEEQGVQWGGKVKNRKPGAFVRLPVAKDISFSVLNFAGEYCPEATGTKADVLRDGTKIKLKAGYKLRTELPGRMVAATLNGANAYNYHTEYSTGIRLAPATPSITEKYFQDFFETKYDTEDYGDSHYTPAGVFVYTWDLDGAGFSRVSRINLTTNFTTGTIYYRSLANLDAGGEALGTSAYWTSAGSPTGATQAIQVSPAARRFFQVAVLWDGTAWDQTKKLTALSILAHDRIEWIYDQVYTLDPPSYTDPENPAIARLNCQGFDAVAKLLEQDFNFQDLSGGVTLDTMIKQVLDGVGVKYTATSIAGLSSYGIKTTNPLTEPMKAGEVIEKLLELLLRVGAAFEAFVEYDEATDDEIMYLQPRPTAYYAVSVLDHEKYKSIGGRKISRGNLLQRITVIDGTVATDAEALLDSETGYTTQGVLTLSWLSNAIFRRIVITTNSGSPTVSVTSSGKNSVALTITGTFNIDVKIYGCTMSTEPTYWAEWYSIGAILDGRGYTHTIENGWIGSDAEALAVAKGYAAEYGDPSWEIDNCRWPYLHLLFEVNDPAMVWSRVTFNGTIHRVIGIRHNWSRAQSPDDSTQIDLQDTGLDYLDQGAIIYDRDRAPVLGSVINYDYGFVYDMQFGPNGLEADVPTSQYRIYNVNEA